MTEPRKNLIPAQRSRFPVHITYFKRDIAYPRLNDHFYFLEPVGTHRDELVSNIASIAIENVTILAVDVRRYYLIVSWQGNEFPHSIHDRIREEIARALAWSSIPEKRDYSRRVAEFHDMIEHWDPSAE